MDNLHEQLKPLGIDETILKTALTELKLVPTALPESKGEELKGVTVNQVDQTSLTACLAKLTSAGVDEFLVEQVGCAIYIHVETKLVCDSNLMFGIMLEVLKRKGLSKSTVAKCKAYATTKPGDRLPRGNPAMDVLLFTLKKGMEDEKIALLGTAISEYLNDMVCE